jgi:hypothetical protein
LIESRGGSADNESVHEAALFTWSFFIPIYLALALRYYGREIMKTIRRFLNWFDSLFDAPPKGPYGLPVNRD